MKIGFVGLEHLGTVSSIAAAAKGFQVACYDPDPKNLLPAPLGRWPSHSADEPHLQAAFASCYERFSQMALSPSELADCSLIFFTKDVEKPEDESAVRSMIYALQSVIPPTVPFVIMSQVRPGFTRGLRWGGRPFFYQMDTLITKQAYERAFHPERIVIGCKDPKNFLPEDYDMYLSAYQCPVLKMDIESAELAKLAMNMFLASQLATTNVLSQIGKHVGADWDDVAEALRYDARVGPKAYLRPGIIGGHPPRDVKSLALMAQNLDLSETLFEAVKEWFYGADRDNPQST